MTAERQSFQARTGALAEVMGYIERRSRALGLPRSTTLKLLLVAEELFINTVLHGYGGDSAGTVAFTLRDLGTEVELVAEDQAPAFDPFAQLPAVSGSRDPQARPVGGLGRVLVSGLSSRHSYERRDGSNRISVCLPKKSPER